jgi:hypothetical protein
MIIRGIEENGVGYLKNVEVNSNIGNKSIRRYSGSAPAPPAYQNKRNKM